MKKNMKDKQLTRGGEWGQRRTRRRERTKVKI